MRLRFGMVISIFIIVSSVAVVDFFVEKFLTKKENNNFKIVSNNIAKNILDNEKQTEERLKIATLLLEKYLQENPLKNNPDLDRENLMNFVKLTNIDRVTLLDSNGKILAATNLILSDEKVRESVKNYSVLDRITNPSDFLSQDHNVVAFPMGRDTVTGVTSKSIAMLSKKLNMILTCAMEMQIQMTIKDNLSLHKEIQYISVSTPSGKLFADSKESINSQVSVVDNYSDDIQIIENNNDNIKLQLCFGGLQKENAIRIIDKTVNSKNQYFYVLTTEFSKKDINKQIFSTRIIFSIICALIFGVVFLVDKQFQLKNNYKLSLITQARQIHHDVVSPLQALDWGINGMTRDKSIMDGEKAIELKQSVEAIKSIVADLYYIHDDSVQKELKFSTELVYPIIHSSLASAKLLLGYGNEESNRKLVFKDTKDFNLLVNTDPATLRRVLLNLIKNAIESKGNVVISLRKENNNAVITITDTGCGIPEDILKQMMSGKQITHGKDGGRGLGFSYSKQTIEQLGGTIELKSEVNKGTTQIIILPLEIAKPSWFVDKVDLKNIKTVVIVDDFAGIHKIWDERLKDKRIKIVHIYNSKDCDEFMKSNKNKTDIFYFIDFSLETISDNGIALIKKYKLQNQAILVTSKYLEQFVKEQSIENGIKILPKEFISLIGV